RCASDRREEPEAAGAPDPDAEPGRRLPEADQGREVALMAADDKPKPGRARSRRNRRARSAPPGPTPKAAASPSQADAPGDEAPEVALHELPAPTAYDRLWATGLPNVAAITTRELAA